jgi:rare lipoprotein A
MNNLNNKRYLYRFGIAALFLCASLVGLSAAAQTAEATEALPNEAVKTEETKTPEQTPEPSPEFIPELVTETISGLASFYAAKFNGRRTASGEKFSSKILTAAHLTLPFGTLLKVTNPNNTHSVIVRINDRGPYIRGRLLDLSRAAADRLGITRLGVARVEIEVLKP